MIWVCEGGYVECARVAAGMELLVSDVGLESGHDHLTLWGKGVWQPLQLFYLEQTY